MEAMSVHDAVYGVCISPENKKGLGEDFQVLI